MFNPARSVQYGGHRYVTGALSKTGGGTEWAPAPGCHSREMEDNQRSGGGKNSRPANAEFLKGVLDPKKRLQLYRTIQAQLEGEMVLQLRSGTMFACTGKTQARSRKTYC
uniref:Uncharacterized protein n=1 Tax=Peronospora matthiolae TaxID=2874970 RepID=A0AAV1VPS2_9STRA